MLNELLEDYQEFNEDEALEEFTKLLWSSKYGLRTYKKYYSFTIQESALNNNEELVKVFEPYQNIELKYAKSYYNEKMSSIDMIRIHINNMFMYLTDKEVYLSSDYYKQMKIPKQKYYDTIKDIKDKKDINIEELRLEIEQSVEKASILKEERIKSKINLSFKEYKEVINNYIIRLFNNYKTPEQYENEFGWELNVLNDAWHEDNYIVKYFCKSLTGYMMNYIRDNSHRKKQCKSCCIILSNRNRSGYCKNCYQEYRKKYIKRKVSEFRKNVNS